MPRFLQIFLIGVICTLFDMLMKYKYFIFYVFRSNARVFS
jgi:hypothetical protein